MRSIQSIQIYAKDAGWYLTTFVHHSLSFCWKLNRAAEWSDFKICINKCFYRGCYKFKKNLDNLYLPTSQIIFLISHWTQHAELQLAIPDEMRGWEGGGPRSQVPGPRSGHRIITKTPDQLTDSSLCRISLALSDKVKLRETQPWSERERGGEERDQQEPAVVAVVVVISRSREINQMMWILHYLFSIINFIVSFCLPPPAKCWDFSFYWSI